MEISAFHEHKGEPPPIYIKEKPLPRKEGPEKQLIP